MNMSMKLCTMILLVEGATAFSPAVRPTLAGSSTVSSHHETTTLLSSLGNDFFKKSAPAMDATATAAPRSRTLQSFQKRDAVLDPDYTLTWSMALLGALIMWYTPGM
jgi:hypothetical protein